MILPTTVKASQRPSPRLQRPDASSLKPQLRQPQRCGRFDNFVKRFTRRKGGASASLKTTSRNARALLQYGGAKASCKMRYLLRLQLPQGDLLGIRILDHATALGRTSRRCILQGGQSLQDARVLAT